MNNLFKQGYRLQKHSFDFLLSVISLPVVDLMKSNDGYLSPTSSTNDYGVIESISNIVMFILTNVFIEYLLNLCNASC